MSATLPVVKLLSLQTTLAHFFNVYRACRHARLKPSSWGEQYYFFSLGRNVDAYLPIQTQKQTLAISQNIQPFFCARDSTCIVKRKPKEKKKPSNKKTRSPLIKLEYCPELRNQMRGWEILRLHYENRISPPPIRVNVLGWVAYVCRLLTGRLQKAAPLSGF